jgi:hypothetical protein
VLIALAPAAAADEAVSTTPYMALYQVLTPARVIGSYDRLVAIERIQSKLGGVPPSDIRVVIRAKSGAIPVPIAADGRVNFPTSDALRDENPPVETNQPKGSLALTVIVGLGGAERLRLPWTDVEAGLEQVKKFYADNVPSGATAPSVRGMVFVAGDALETGESIAELRALFPRSEVEDHLDATALRAESDDAGSEISVEVDRFAFLVAEVTSCVGLHCCSWSWRCPSRRRRRRRPKRTVSSCSRTTRSSSTVSRCATGRSCRRSSCGRAG